MDGGESVDGGERWMARTVDGGDGNGGKRIIIGITVKLLSNHCPNYVRNHWRITKNVHLGTKSSCQSSRIMNVD